MRMPGRAVLLLAVSGALHGCAEGEGVTGPSAESHPPRLGGIGFGSGGVVAPGGGLGSGGVTTGDTAGVTAGDVSPTACDPLRGGGLGSGGRSEPCPTETTP